MTGKGGGLAVLLKAISHAQKKIPSQGSRCFHQPNSHQEAVLAPQWLRLNMCRMDELGGLFPEGSL